MKVAYVFSTSGHTASYKLGKMILPQLEQGTHGVEVVGMFFFDDNTYLLRAGDPVGERLGRVAAERGMLLMLCDQCALERCLAEGEIGAALPAGTVAGVRVGCFPDVYAALARPAGPCDHVVRGPNWPSVGSAQQNHGSVSRGLPSVDPMGMASGSGPPGSPVASRTAARIRADVRPVASCAAALCWTSALRRPCSRSAAGSADRQG